MELDVETGQLIYGPPLGLGHLLLRVLRGNISRKKLLENEVLQDPGGICVYLFFSCSLGNCIASHSVSFTAGGRKKHAHLHGEGIEVLFSMMYQKIYS